MRVALIIFMLVTAPLSAFANESGGGHTNGSLSGLTNSIIGDNNEYDSNTTITQGGVQQAGTVVNQATDQKIRNVVPVDLTNLVAGGSDVCLGSASVGASAPGFSVSGGSTTVDENCVMMKRVHLLTALGLTDAAVSLLINADDDLAMAFYYAYPKMVEAFAPEKYEQILNDIEKAKKKKQNCSFNCN